LPVKVYSEVLGREVEVPEEPERIVSLAPAITETLYHLGVWDRVVGVSFFCNKPPEAAEKPRVGSYFNVNWRKLEELNPDLILVTTGAQRKTALELAERGYTVYPVPLPTSLAGVVDMAVQVGLVVGALDEARRLEAALLEKASRLPRVDPPVRVYYEIDLGGPVSVGGHSYIVDALDRIGLHNVFRRDRVPWVINPDMERVRAYKPQLIVYERAPYKPVAEEKIVEDLKSRLQGTPAVEEERIIILPPDSLAHYGPSLLEALAGLAERARDMLGG